MTALGEVWSQGPGTAGVRRLQLVEGWIKGSILSERRVSKKVSDLFNPYLIIV